MDNKFNKFEQQLNKSSNKGGTLYTGAANVKVLGINPTQDQLAEILGDAGRAEKFDTDYAIKENTLIGKQVRPVCIWVTDESEQVSPTLFTIELINEVHSARNTDSIRIINNYLQSTWSASVEAVTSNPKMSWFSDTGIRLAKVNEENYYIFLATLLRYDLQGEVSFMTFVNEMGLDYDTVYGGNFTGLRDLVEYANSKDFVFAGLFAVKEKVSEEGTKYRQELINNSELWYRSTAGASLDWVQDNIKVKKDKKESEGYSLTNRLFTYEFVPFNKDKCVNAAPETPKVSSWV